MNGSPFDIRYGGRPVEGPTIVILPTVTDGIDPDVDEVVAHFVGFPDPLSGTKVWRGSITRVMEVVAMMARGYVRTITERPPTPSAYRDDLDATARCALEAELSGVVRRAKAMFDAQNEQEVSALQARIDTLEAELSGALQREACLREERDRAIFDVQDMLARDGDPSMTDALESRLVLIEHRLHKLEQSAPPGRKKPIVNTLFNRYGPPPEDP